MSSDFHSIPVGPAEKNASNEATGGHPGDSMAGSAKQPVAPTYFNRELSWLEFNARVLEEAASPETPLLEKLKFLSIYSTNLDEFYMVRVAGLKKVVEEDLHTSDSPDTMSGDEVLSGIRKRVNELSDSKQRILREEVLPGLRHHGIEIVQIKDLSDFERQKLEVYFREQVFPVLTPLAVDPAHPFPFLTNMAVYLLVNFRESSAGYDESHDRPAIGLVEVPAVLPRLIPVQPPPRTGNASEDDHRRHFVMLEDLVGENLSTLFLGFEIAGVSAIKVTRNLDYTLLENEVVDLLKSVQRELTSREHQEAVRLEVAGDLPAHVIEFLMQELHLKQSDIYYRVMPLNLNGLMSLYGLPLPHLKDMPFNPRLPRRMDSPDDMFDLVAEEDLLLHHPFDSFYPVVEFLQFAAHDPNVLAIKMTLYRTGGDSPIIDALIAAAENGKQVTAVVELKARFDEKNNISWARRLERAGVNVVFGFVGLKTHAKLLLVVRREGGKLVRYVNLSNGNYNSASAKLYTDLSFFTNDDDIGYDVSTIFNLLTGFNIFSEENRLKRKVAVPQFKKLGVAPLTLRSKLIDLIKQETVESRKTGRGVLVFKMNSLVDKETIDCLYEASQAGVDVKLIVRGICCLKPGIPGLSDNIRVISIVDRFLEHSRIYYFGGGGQSQLFLSSADCASRNFDRRIEVLFPIEDPDLKARIFENLLGTYLADNVKARMLQADGSYVLKKPGRNEPVIRAQQRLIEMARDRGLKSIPYEKAIRHDAVKVRGARPVAKTRKSKDQKPGPRS